MNKMKKLFYFILINLLFSDVLSAQTRQYTSYDPKVVLSHVLIEENFTTQLEVYPQEKIHLHTDRDFYVPGEKIWFKAYVVEAHSHLHPTYSQYVYVELISPENTIVNRVMIRQTDGIFHGHLPITESIPEGNYTLRAYTRYMENLGDDYFFKKNIRIGNLVSAKKKLPQTISMEKDDFDVSFFPEGGNLLEGIFCKVAFKALNKNGYAETVSGKLVDETGEELASVETYYAGMGIIGFVPESGKRIYLKCSNANGLEKQFELPQPEPIAYSLTISLRGNRFLISVQKSINAPDIPLYLLSHCRGKILYCSEWDKNRSFILFHQEQLPAGVIQFVLFDQQMYPLSERLVFNKNDDVVAKVEFRTDKEAYEKREKAISILSLSDFSDYAHFSVAITDDKDIAIDETTTVFSSLLLSSELKGYIENSAYYLQDNNESNTALDYLMMTHGWRRYNVPELMMGNIKSPQIPFQIAHEITGRVIGLLSSNPVAESEVIIMSKEGETTVTFTDKEGFFAFHDFNIPDSARYLIQALSRNRRGNAANVALEVDQESFPELVYAPQRRLPESLQIKSDTISESDAVSFLEKADQRAKFDEDMWTIQLEEVAITAQRARVKGNDPRLTSIIPFVDKTITKETIEKYASTYVADLLPIAGYRVLDNGELMIKNMKVQPVVIIDGIEQRWPDKEKLDHKSESPVERIPVNLIESIEVVKGQSAVVFGSRGVHGAIIITTKIGSSSLSGRKNNQSMYAPLGYQKPVEFYSPKYETQQSKFSAIPDYRTTIFWKPDLVISDETEEASFEFFTSDFKTTYSVVIEGLTSDGRIIRKVEKIRVE